MLLQDDAAEMQAAERPAEVQFPWQLKCCSLNGETRLYNMPDKDKDLFFAGMCPPCALDPLQQCSCCPAIGRLIQYTARLRSPTTLQPYPTLSTTLDSSLSCSLHALSLGCNYKSGHRCLCAADQCCCNTGVSDFSDALTARHAATVEWAPESAAQYDVSALERPQQSESSVAAAQREEERSHSSFTLQQCLEVGALTCSLPATKLAARCIM